MSFRPQTSFLLISNYRRTLGALPVNNHILGKADFFSGVIPPVKCGISRRTFKTSKRLAHAEIKLPEYYEGRLEGTTPDHLCHLFLHASRSPETFPPVYHTPLSRELHLRAKQWGGLVNFSWFADETTGTGTHYQSATLFSQLSGKLEIPHISLENMDQVVELIQAHLKGLRTASISKDMHIYVCTHGARDCRCGERGGQVYDALVQHVKRKQLTDPKGPASHLKIGKVGHIGGHKYAANVLLLPQGEWLGTVKVEDAPSIIDQACEALRRGVEPLGSSAPPLFPTKWRGRMGLSKDEQLELWAQYNVLDSVKARH